MINKIKNILLVILIIALTAVLCYTKYLNSKYSTNIHTYKAVNDSLCTEITAASAKYDSMSIHLDSMYQYELTQKDSLWQLLQISQDKKRTIVTYIYKDSTIIKEVEDTHTEARSEIKTVTEYIEKEVIKYIHDTTYISNIDTFYSKQDTEVLKTQEEKNEEVIDNKEKFNIYADANVKGTTDLDIIPEAAIGIMLYDKFYGQAGIDYNNGNINPFAKIGVRLKLF